MDPILSIGTAVVVIPSITSHEAAHGFAADRLGDTTARAQGRLTLNPLPHIDPVLTILMPGLLLLFGSPILLGGAKPVPVNVTRLRYPRREAGPLTPTLVVTSPFDTSSIVYSALSVLLG